MDVKDIILAASIAKGSGGGSGGGVTKEYVDTQVGAVSERVDDVEDVIPSTATAQNKLATSADVSGNSIPSTSTTSPLTDSADGMVQGVTIYGRSKKSKNLLEITAESQTINGVTFTVDKAAGTITANGTASGNINFYITPKMINNFSGMKISGSPRTENDRITILISYLKEDGTYRSEQYSYNEAVSTLVDSPKILFAIYIVADTTVSNLVFKPMLCTAADYAADPTFEPYFEGIKSVGDDGLTVTTANSDNTVTTSAEFTTALPLRSTLDGTTRDELIIGNGKAEAITRCEVVDDNIVPLATPVTTPLTTAEISAFRGLRTYDSTTNITITDEPDFEIDYLKNTDNGQAVSNIQKDLQGQIDGLKIKTLTYTGTGTSTNTITFPEVPVCIFSFVNKQGDSYGNFNWTNPFTWNSPYITIYYTGSSSGSRSTAVSYTGNTLTLTGSDAGLAMNRSDTEYNIYYI